MSAYVVKAKTIDELVSWVADELEWNRSSPITHLAEKYNIPIAGEGWEEVLAACMMQLNCDAVNHRYTDHPGKEEVGDYTYYAVLSDASAIQAFKTLFGWLYQCREGDIPQTSLYQFFNEINHEQAVKIVRELPAYDQAQWV